MRVVLFRIDKAGEPNIWLRCKSTLPVFSPNVEKFTCLFVGFIR